MAEQDENKNRPPEREPASETAGSVEEIGVSGESRQGGTRPPPPPTADVHAYIGRQLRAVYDDVAKQPVPDRFVELMKQLEARTGGR